MPKGAHRKPKVTIVKPALEVWQHALAIARGDSRRLEVVEEGKAVIVWNAPRR